MKPSRIRTLLIGLAAGVAYAFLAMFIVTLYHENVSVAFIFLVPIIMGAIPVFFSSKEQLTSYRRLILLPWGTVLTFIILSYISGFEGMICLVIIVGPFLLLGTLGAFVIRLLRLKREGTQTPLYASVLLPFLFLICERQMTTTIQPGTVVTTVVIDADRSEVWQHVKNIRHIQPAEIAPHFIHLIGIPKPIDGSLDKDGIGGVRSITWEKGIKFQEVIKVWK